MGLYADLYKEQEQGKPTDTNGSENIFNTPEPEVEPGFGFKAGVIPDITPEPLPFMSKFESAPKVQSTPEKLSYAQLYREQQEEGVIEPSTWQDPAEPTPDFETERRTGEGFFGGVGDTVAGLTSGAITGLEMVSKSFEWFAPEGSDVELGANTVRKYLEDLQKENEYYLGESKRSEEAREGSYLNPRGWIYGGLESIGMIVPTSMVAGPAGVFGQFWGSTAQDAYDETVENEKNGVGRRLSEEEKVAYANLRGFWEGGIEAIQTKLFRGLGKGITKFLPKTVKGNIIRSAVKQPGNPFYNAAKSFTKTLAQEEAMELFQEYAGQKTAYEFGQSTTDPGWNEVKAVIGPTFVMTAVFGTMGGISTAKRQKQLHDTLTNPTESVHPEDRAAAATIVYEIVKKEDIELAEQWKEMVAPAVKINAPVAIPLDAEVQNITAETKQQDLADTQVGVVKLNEAKTIEEQIENKKTENLELNAQVEARNEAKTETRVTPQIEEEVKVVPGEEVPNAEGVIEPEIEKTTKSLPVIERQIKQYNETLKEMPADDPRRTKIQEALMRVEAERDNLISPAPQSAENVQKPSSDSDTNAIEQGEVVKLPKRPKIITQEYIEDKYKNVLSEEVIDEADNLSINFDSNNFDTQDLINELQTSDNINLTKQSLRAHIGDRVGDLVETSRYESEQEGIEYEGKIDEWLATVNDFRKETQPQINLNDSSAQNLVDNKSEIKYSIKVLGELRVPVEEIPENMEVTTGLISAESGQEVTTKFRAREAIKSIDSLITKLDSILECVQ